MMMSENGSPVSWHVHESIVEITLARPPANALGPPIIDGLHAGLDAADSLPAKAIVVSSALNGFFAAGADIKHMSSVDAASFAEYGDKLRAVVERLAAHPAISVAAIDGLALGGGLELAMACNNNQGPYQFDIRVHCRHLLHAGECKHLNWLHCPSFAPMPAIQNLYKQLLCKHNCAIFLPYNRRAKCHHPVSNILSMHSSLQATK